MKIEFEIQNVHVKQKLRKLVTSSTTLWSNTKQDSSSWSKVKAKENLIYSEEYKAPKNVSFSFDYKTNYLKQKSILISNECQNEIYDHNCTIQRSEWISIIVNACSLYELVNVNSTGLK